MGDLVKEALVIGWPLFALVAGLFVYSLVSIKDGAARKRATFKLFIGMIAACMLMVAVAHYKGSFYEANRTLPASLVLITAMCFMMGIYFPNQAAMLRIGGFMFLVAAGLLPFPQTRARAPSEKRGCSIHPSHDLRPSQRSQSPVRAARQSSIQT